MPSEPISVFFSYSRKDQALMEDLMGHLEPLRRSQLIRSWYDGCISPGEEWEPQIKENLERAQIILLLVSVDFINSDYCYTVELSRAIARHKAGEACVIPVILRSCLWQGVPVGDMRLGDLQALPKDARPISQWSDLEEAYTSIAEGLYDTIQQLRQEQVQATNLAQPVGWAPPTIPPPPLTPPSPPAEDDLSSERRIDYSRLRDLLKAQDWRAADAETYEVMIRAVGKKPGQKHTHDELLNFPCIDLRTIDSLWVKYSQGKFGFSVQKKIYVECGANLIRIYPGDKIWFKFCDRVGWRKGSKYLNYSDLKAKSSLSPTGEFPVWMWGVGREDGRVVRGVAGLWGGEVAMRDLFSRTGTCL